jgi:hypothetical protein
VSAARSIDIAHLQRAIHRAHRTSTWVVVVYPDAATAQTARKIVPAMVPLGSAASGRTVVLAGGGRVSVVAAVEPLPDTEEPFFTVFLGWAGGSEEAYRGMATWRNRSSSTIVVGDGG